MAEVQPRQIQLVTDDEEEVAAPMTTTAAVRRRTSAKQQATPCFASRPSVVHFGGFAVGETRSLTIELVNITAKAQRLAVLRPNTAFFRIRDRAKKGSVAPGMADSLTIDFTPDSQRYYYDAVSVKFAGGELTVPLHAYPRMNNVQLPSRLDFAAGLDEVVEKSVELRCDVPIAFEYRVTTKQKEQGCLTLTTEPEGIVPANGSVRLAFRYAPSKFCTTTLECDVEVSQLDAKPHRLTLTGSCHPVEKPPPLPELPVPPPKRMSTLKRPKKKVAAADGGQAPVPAPPVDDASLGETAEEQGREEQVDEEEEEEEVEEVEVEENPASCVYVDEAGLDDEAIAERAAGVGPPTVPTPTMISERAAALHEENFALSASAVRAVGFPRFCEDASAEFAAVDVAESEIFPSFDDLRPLNAAPEVRERAKFDATARYFPPKLIGGDEIMAVDGAADESGWRPALTSPAAASRDEGDPRAAWEAKFFDESEPSMPAAGQLGPVGAVGREDVVFEEAPELSEVSLAWSLRPSAIERPSQPRKAPLTALAYGQQWPTTSTVWRPRRERRPSSLKCLGAQYHLRGWRVESAAPRPLEAAEAELSDSESDDDEATSWEAPTVLACREIFLRETNEDEDDDPKGAALISDIPRDRARLELSRRDAQSRELSAAMLPERAGSTLKRGLKMIS